MTPSILVPGRSSGVLKPIARATILTTVLCIIIYASAKALSSAVWNEEFPESLAVKVELLPLIFPLHMVTGALALILLPITLALRRKRRWHRPAGRITAMFVLVSGLTAFPVALMAPVTPVSAAGFTAQATTWLTLLALGIYNIRRGRVAAHRVCMILMVATTSGAVFFRINLALWAIYGRPRLFDAFYAFDAWAAWMVPLAVCAAMIAYPRHQATSPS